MRLFGGYLKSSVRQWYAWRRSSLYLQEFQYDIRFKTTAEHRNADALLHLPLHSEDIPPQLNSNEMIDESKFFT